MKFALICTIAPLVTYLAVSVFVWDFNPGSWPVGLRWLALLITLFLTGVLIVRYA